MAFRKDFERSGRVLICFCNGNHLHKFSKITGNLSRACVPCKILKIFSYRTIAMPVSSGKNGVQKV
jgi:hypothetical protein